MGFKKKLAYSLLTQAARNPNFRGYLKKAVIFVLVAGILLFALAASLIGFGISQVNKIISNQSNYEITALERLISEKEITLSGEQKTEITTLLRQLNSEEQTSGDADSITTEILALLDNKQMESVNLRVEQMKAGAKELTNTGRSVLEENVSKYTGISIETGRQLIQSISEWWQFSTPNNEATQNLLREIESSSDN